MKRLLAVASLTLAACSANSMLAKEPFAVRESSRTREVVTDCLLNRMIAEGRSPRVSRGPSETTIAFVGLAGNAGWVFVVRDSSGGSVTEMRRAASFATGLAAAETCF